MNPKAIYLKSYHFLTLGKYNLFTFKSRAMHVQKIIDTKSITEIKQEITTVFRHVTYMFQMKMNE